MSSWMYVCMDEVAVKAAPFFAFAVPLYCIFEEVRLYPPRPGDLVSRKLAKKWKEDLLFFRLEKNKKKMGKSERNT